MGKKEDKVKEEKPKKEVAPKKEEKKVEKEERFVVKVEDMKVDKLLLKVVSKEEKEINGRQLLEVTTVEGCTYLLQSVDDKYELV